jgi:N-acetylglucosamine-6-sulfatase
MIAWAPLRVALAALAGGGLAVAAAIAGSGAPARAGDPGTLGSQGRPPNLIVVMTDDQDARSIWAMPKTRRLLGRAGTTFTRSYATFPLCCPSRATFLTGQYAHNHGVLSNDLPAGSFLALDGAETLPVWLRRAGYVTAHVGRYLNGYGVPLGRGIPAAEAALEIPPGWSRWFAPVFRGRAFRMYRYVLNENGRLTRYKRGVRNYQTDVYARHATRLVRRLAGGERPLFLSFAPLAPHREPRRSRGPNPRPAPRHADAFPRLGLPQPPSFDEADVSDKPPRVQALPRIGAEQREELLRRHRGRIRSLLAVDDAVGAIVAALRRAGELRDTLIVFTSDQGFLLGEHRITHDKLWPYEEATRVPLILRGPGLGVPRGVTREQVTANVDLAPTILDAAGAEPGLEMDGISLLPLARDPGEARGRAVLLQSLEPEHPEFAGVRVPGWSYVVHEDGREELYDLRSDPFQLRSLHADRAHTARKAFLAARLEALRGCAGRACR